MRPEPVGGEQGRRPGTDCQAPVQAGAETGRPTQSHQRAGVLSGSAHCAAQRNHSSDSLSDCNPVETVQKRRRQANSAHNLSV